MTLSMIEPPALDVLSLSEIKQHLRVSDSDEDSLIQDIAQSAVELIEHQIGQKLMTQVWRQYEEAEVKNGVIDLNLHPVRAVQEITFYDCDGEPIILAPHHYQILPHQDKVQILNAGLNIDHSNGIEIDCLVGMAELSLEIPNGLKRALLMLIAHWYEFRGAIVPSMQPIAYLEGVEKLIAPYRRIKL